MARWAAAVALCVSLPFSAAQGQSAATTDRLVLLGTKGGPSVRSDNPFPSSNVLVLKGVPYVVDTGYGVTLRLNQAKVPLQSLRYVFITHHHSDHNLEYGNLLYNAWIVGLKTPVQTYGPKGMVGMDQAIWQAHRFDIETRMADEGRPDLRRLVQAHDLTAGVVLDNGEVKVSAMRNHHPPIEDSYALKFESGGKTIVFSGDTSYHPPLAEFAAGADYLVHEVMNEHGIERMVRRVSTNADTLLEHLKASHTLAEDVGRIAAKARVKNLVLTHFVPSDDRSITDEDWLREVRKHYAGNVIVGRDLLDIPIR
jgi:ribonuclease BN (tRNA processing enzyme)